MKLDKKTKQTLKQLIRIDSEIYIKYLYVTYGNEINKSFEELCFLLQSERNLINSINLNVIRLNGIKKYLQGKSRLNLDENLIKLSLNVDAEHYPYLRVYARMYDEFYRRKIYTDLDNTAFYTEQEVLNLYRLINQLADAQDDLKMRFYSRIMLLNSRTAEEEILKNNFNPALVYDVIEFASELYTVGVTFAKRHDDEDRKVNFERIKAATLSRKNEFYRVFYELIITIAEELPRYAKGDSYFKMLACYFKVMFALLDKTSREYVYEQLENSKVLKDPKFNLYGILGELLESIEDDVEENLLPFVKHLSIFPF